MSHQTTVDNVRYCGETLKFSSGLQTGAGAIVPDVPGACC